MSEPLVRMVNCPDCGKSVPSANMGIHHLTGCGGRAPSASVSSLPLASSSSSSSPPPARVPSPMEIDDDDDDNDDDNNVVEIIDEEDCVEIVDSPQDERKRARVSRRLRPRARRAGAARRASVIDLSQDSPSRPLPPPPVPPAARLPSVASSSNTSNDDSSNEWSCPRCTLLNPNSQPICNACQFQNNDLRAPDQTRTERLIDDDDYISPFASIGSGALLGSVLGGAGAYMRGDSVSSGVMGGAVSGAIGGAVIESLRNSSSSNRAASINHPSYADAARSSRNQDSSSRNHMASSSVRRSNRIRSRPAVRFQVRTTRNGLTTLSGSDWDDDLLTQMLLSNFGIIPNSAANNIDNMGYEQLLQAFGDGTENRGSDEAVIRSLPTSTIRDPEQELPEDARECAICLEAFQTGEARKTLQCLHGFHEGCIDKWLRSNGSCPICKHCAR